MSEPKTKKEQLAKLILTMSYGEIHEVASDLIDMQKGAKEDGWEWRPDEVDGSHGLMAMLYSWAEGNE